MRDAVALLAAESTSGSEGDIGWLGLVASFVLVAIAVGVSALERLGLGRSILWASARALVQLLAVGVVLAVVFDSSRSVALAFGWVFLMVLAASATIAVRAREVPGIFGLALVACLVAEAVSLGVLFGLGVFPVEARTLIPMAGLTLGNTMAAAVVSCRRIVSELSDKRPEVEARLALGQPWRDASRPYVRNALRTALVPQIETTKAVGLVALPGAMTGLLLAGVAPLDAVRVQAAVMYVVLGSVATTVTVISIGLTRRLFTADHRLVRLERAA